MPTSKMWLLAVAVFIVLFGLAYIYDDLRAKQIYFEMKASPSEAPADGESVVTIAVQVLDSSKPRVGDNITLRTASGNTDVTRARTDSRGIATFHFFVPKSNMYQKAEDVVMIFKDESVSKWIEIDPKYSFKYHLFEPTSNSNSQRKNVYDDIFK